MQQIKTYDLPPPALSGSGSKGTSQLLAPLVIGPLFVFGIIVKQNVDLRQGVIQISTGAWLDIKDAKGLCQRGNPNVLCLDKGISKLGQGPSAHSCLVEVELLEKA